MKEPMYQGIEVLQFANDKNGVLRDQYHRAYKPFIVQISNIKCDRTLKKVGPGETAWLRQEQAQRYNELGLLKVDMGDIFNDASADEEDQGQDQKDQGTGSEGSEAQGDNFTGGEGGGGAAGEGAEAQANVRPNSVQEGQRSGAGRRRSRSSD